MSTLIKSKHPLIHWFSSTKELMEIGFTKTEIQKAIKDAKTKLSDLTNDYNFVEKGKESHVVDNTDYYEVINENTRHTFKEVEYRKGKEWVHEYEAPAIQFRSFSSFQTHDPEILEKLLKSKFPFIKKFDWDVYAIHSEGINWEIYLKTSKGSLYVPVTALMKKDPKIIEKRMFDYHNDFRNKRDPKVTKHNHKRNEHQCTNGGCPLCQEKFFQKEMAPLYTTEAKKLFQEMKN